MTEEDTFNALRRAPFKEVLRAWLWTGKSLTVINVKNFLETNYPEWSWYEFVNEYINEKNIY